MATLINPQSRKTNPLVRLPRGYVELLARSNFSFLQGASHPEEMVEEAMRLDYNGLAISDLGGLYGVGRGFAASKAASSFTAGPAPKDGFRFLTGAELLLTDESTLAVIPKTQLGYSNLCRMLTQGKRNVEKYFCRIHPEDLREWGEDLIALALPPWNEKQLEFLQQVFGNSLFLPVWRDLTWESLEFCQKAFALEEQGGFQLVVTQRAFMHHRERKPLFDVLTCIHHQTQLENAKSILIQNGERYLRPLGDLYKLWSDRPDLVEKTLQIADSVQFQLSDIRYRYPKANLPEGRTSYTHLAALTEKGLQDRYPQGVPLKVQAQAQKELTIIQELEYEDYFLTLFEICEFAQQKGILYQGRGSAASSVVCFALKLTSVDPNQIDVLFERFISRERGEPPDIDIDFEHERREEVIQHIYSKYDAMHAGMVCTVIRYKARLALRETAKVLGIPLQTVNSVIKYMGREGLGRLQSEENLHTRWKIPQEDFALWLHLTAEIRGFPRHLGIHTGGFIITHDLITDLVPVEKATMNGRYVIQWNKDDVNNLGLMKIDVLSLGMLTALRKGLDSLRSEKGLNYNLATLPQEDPKTYEMICQADTVGVFQIESRAQMNTLPRVQPKTFYDLVIEVALVRPGPLQGGMVHPFLRRRQGLEKVDYAIPELESVLHKTMGVPIFQEQVMRIAVVAAGFTPGEADELRRIMSAAWRRKGTMDGIRTRILEGMKKKGISEKYAERIYQTIAGFANYGFPESHAASFALLTYASCYIKCHHPDIFVCSLLNSQPMGFYSPRVLINDAQRHGVQVKALDVQRSFWDYSYEDNDEKFKTVRVGFRSIYGLQKKWIEELTQERTANGPFLSLDDFIRRTRLPRPALMKLAASGAFRSWGAETAISPRDLIWQIQGLCLDESSLFWTHQKDGNDMDEDFVPPSEGDWEELTRQISSHGFSTENHPLSVLRSSLEARNQELRKKAYVPFSSSKDLIYKEDQSSTRVAGLVGIRQKPPTAKGMCFLTLEDEWGFINVVIPPPIYEKHRITIFSNSLLEVRGVLEKRHGVTNLKASSLFPLQRD